MTLDLSNAFDRVNWNALWLALHDHCISDHLVWILQLIYANQLGEVNGQRSTVNPVRPIGQPVSGTGGEIVKLLPIYINACRPPQSQADLNTISQDQLQRSPVKVNSSSGKNL